MTPEQHIAESAQAEMDQARQKMEEAKLRRQRVFIGMGIFLSIGGSISAIFAPGWGKLPGIVLLFGGLDLIFFQRFVDRKT